MRILQKFSRFNFLLIAILTIFVFVSSCNRESDNEQRKEEVSTETPTDTPADISQELCSNEKYKTKKVEAPIDYDVNLGNLVQLDFDDNDKFKEAVSKGANPIKELQGLYCLQKLEITSGNHKEISGIENFKNLKILHLDVSDFKNIDNLSDLTNLEKLGLTSFSPVATELNLKPLSKLKKLRSLSVSYLSSKDNFEFLKSLKKLETIYFQNINNDGNWTLNLSPISSLQNIKTLRIWGASKYDFKLENLDVISNFGNLTNLEIEGIDFDPKPINNLAKLEKLYLLSLSDDITSLNLDNLPNLKLLWIENSNVEDYSFLKNLPSLEDILILNTPITDISPFKTLTNATEIEFQESATDDQCDELKTAVNARVVCYN